TKLKHNNCNHRGSLDWKRHALTVPLEAFVMSDFSAIVFLCIFVLSTFEKPVTTSKKSGTK
ncbi:hypothetical protein, partial [Vibrio cholerae]|uniref:hypothetical protein n=1 Tax=Vibrio cholerae TaxID=666 RepID=UPI003080CDE9